jgi:DNA replication factor GINS
MNLDELRSVQSKERQKDSLQNLRPSFYQEVGEYIAELEDERERVAEQADDPFSSPEVGRLTDEIETAKDVVEAVYERRMGKLVKQASLAAAGMAADDEGLTAEEADLFEDLVDRIRSNKTRVLDVLEGVEPESGAGATEAADSSATVESGAPAGSQPEPDPPDDAPPTPPMEPDLAAGGGEPDPTDFDPAEATEPATVDLEGEESTTDESDGVTAADVMGGSGPTVNDGGDVEGPSPAAEEPSPEVEDPELDSQSTPSREDGTDEEPTVSDASDTADDPVDRITVRMTRDVGSILGVDDREYTLSSDDVVTLPEQNASPLLERDAAEPLE